MCLFRDPGDGEWKGKVEFVGVRSRIEGGGGKVTLKRERSGEGEDEDGWYEGV
jgi:hypothetical protein